MCVFTKGKWKYEETENNPINGTWYQITDKEGLIAICTRDNDFARLIAAAPEMFRLLDTISYLWDSGAIIDNTGNIRRAQELISRIDSEEE